MKMRVKMLNHWRDISICLCIYIVITTIDDTTAVNLQKELTVRIEPGNTECFYETAKNGHVIDLEYQVIDGGHGDLDITFEMQNPHGYPLVTEYKKSDNIHRLTAHQEGDYRFCFDNSFSRFNRKSVFFELIIEKEGEEAKANENEWGSDILEGLTPDELVDVKIQDIQDIITHLHGNLNRIKHDLDIRRSFEARDRNIAEESNFRVGTWSFVQICLMLIVGGVQVFMLRSLFETDPRANIWRKFKILN